VATGKEVPSMLCHIKPKVQATIWEWSMMYWKREQSASGLSLTIKRGHSIYSKMWKKLLIVWLKTSFFFVEKQISLWIALNRIKNHSW